MAIVNILPPTGDSTEYNNTVSSVVLLGAGLILIAGIGLIVFVVMRKR